MGANDAARLPFLFAEIRLLESAVARAVSWLGICLGGQLLASALGARVYLVRSTNSGWRDIVPRVASRSASWTPAAQASATVE
jgi:GMP synthase-like glutamine amidotransferase